MTEKEIWLALKKRKPIGHWTRIENAVTSGIPDVYVCVGPNDFWLELKVLHRLIRFRPSQLAWMSTRMREDRDTVIVAADDMVWRIYFFIECINNNAFIMHLNQPHLDTSKAPTVMDTTNVNDVVNFITMKLR